MTLKREALQFIKDQGILDNTCVDDPIVKILNKEGSVVYHKIDGKYLMGMGDKVRMISYLLITPEDYDSEESLEYFKENVVEGYHFSYTINHTWSIQEYGSITAVNENGLLKRIG